MAVITKNLTINPENSKDRAAVTRAFNSTTMSSSAKEHFIQNQKKTKNIKVGNIYNNDERKDS